MHPPGFIEPCLPTVSRMAPTGPPWAFEIKHDGFRFICLRDGDRVRAFKGSKIRIGFPEGCARPHIRFSKHATARSIIAGDANRFE